MDGASHDGQDALVAGRRGQRAAGHAPDATADRAGEASAAHSPLWVCPDARLGGVYSGQTQRPFASPGTRGKADGPGCARGGAIFIAHVVKRYERRRVVETERRLVDGTPARVETLRRRSQGDGVINTAYIERPNATFRARLASLTRRGRALARWTVTLQHGMYLRGTVYNFCTPHASLAHAKGGTTPAMAADITDHCWTVRELLSFHVPPPRWTPPQQRGRPSHAFKRLIGRWCGDHN